jgi:fructose/tagatose bisphosphate aldolase
VTNSSSIPAVTIHALAQAEAALAAARPGGVLLLSAPGAAGFAGPAWFLELVAEAARRHPAVPCPSFLDCADAPGTALAAIRAGARGIILDGNCPAFPAVAAAAAEAGAVILPARPPSLDLGLLDLRRRDDLARLAAWLAMEPP